MINKIDSSPKNFYTANGQINFYASKSYGKHALSTEFDILTTLNAYRFNISLFTKNTTLRDGLIEANFAPKIQFAGDLIEFNFRDLSTNESTVILNGNLRILGIEKQKSFIGYIKKLGNTVYLNSNFIINIEEFNFHKVFKCTELNTVKSIKIEVELQLK